MVDGAPRCADAGRDGNPRYRLRNTCRHPYVPAEPLHPDFFNHRAWFRFITAKHRPKIRRLLGSLKCVHWYNCITMPSAPHWTAFLQRHPEIESLDGKVATTPNAHIKLDAVKILHGYPIRTRRWKAVWSMVDLPAVRSMFYDLTYGIETDDAVTFSRLGQNLTDIQLGFFEYDHMELGVPRFRIALDRIRAECARLTRVVFAVHSWCMLGLYTTLPSTVHTLGIRVMSGQISEANIKKLF
jgi:hypothetical protein